MKMMMRKQNMKTESVMASSMKLTFSKKYIFSSTKKFQLSLFYLAEEMTSCQTVCWLLQALGRIYINKMRFKMLLECVWIQNFNRGKQFSREFEFL